jgi:hypothetical protein
MLLRGLCLFVVDGRKHRKQKPFCAYSVEINARNEYALAIWTHGGRTPNNDVRDGRDYLVSRSVDDEKRIVVTTAFCCNVKPTAIARYGEAIRAIRAVSYII